MHLVGDRNYQEMPSPILREVLGCVEAQIWDKESELAALRMTKAAMQNILKNRGSIEACSTVPGPRLSPDFSPDSSSPLPS